MKGTMTGTGSVFVSEEDHQSYIRGGKGKTGLLTIDIGAGTTVTLEVSTDKGATFITNSTYTTDTSKLVSLPNPNALYSLNCTVYGASTTYSLSSK